MALSVLFAFSPPFQRFAALPAEIRVVQGAVKPLSLFSFGSVTVDNPEVVQVERSNAVQTASSASASSTRASSGTWVLLPGDVGSSRMAVQVGAIPLRKVTVSVIPELRVVPGGQSIGVKLRSAGVLVVGHYLVPHGDRPLSPGREAGVRVGDVITAIDGTTVQSVGDVEKQVRAAGLSGRPIVLKLARGSDQVQVTLRPARDKDGQYRLGLYIRDTAAGVGTLTFYDPKTRRFGALGHVISDVDTRQPIRVGGGVIVPSDVTSIDKGSSGEPGQKRATLVDESRTLGKIEKNTPFGIFGTLTETPEPVLFREPIPIALAEEVREGPAEMLTVVEGRKVERFSIEIVSVSAQRFPATKSMVIRVTDPRLLAKTGGIVQGMSGSPIIQNGKLVGAVTHVFVNDPTTGYGVFIEWMLRDAGYNLDANPTATNKPPRAQAGGFLCAPGTFDRNRATKVGKCRRKVRPTRKELPG